VKKKQTKIREPFDLSLQMDTPSAMKAMV